MKIHHRVQRNHANAEMRANKLKERRGIPEKEQRENDGATRGSRVRKRVENLSSGGWWVRRISHEAGLLPSRKL
jgi:hypothetical protein